MRLETTRFGVLEVDPDSVITFTQPIIGFQDFRRYILLDGPKDSGLTWLQSTESAELAFLLMNPRAVMPEYNVPLHAAEKSELAVTGIGELQVFTLVVVPADPKQVRTNLRAPVLINPKRRLGKQTVLDHSDYPIQFFLAPQGSRAQQESGHARTDA